MIPSTYEGFLSLTLWIIIALCALVIYVVRLGLSWHSWKGTDKRIFRSRAQMAEAKWGSRFAWGILILCVVLGWRFLLYPVFGNL